MALCDKHGVSLWPALVSAISIYTVVLAVFKIVLSNGLASSNSYLPVRLVDWYRVDIDTIFKPSLIMRDLDIVTTHLSLSHASVVGKCPVFETIRTKPLACGIVPLVPELYCNLVVLSVILVWATSKILQTCLVVGEGEELFA